MAEVDIGAAGAIVAGTFFVILLAVMLLMPRGKGGD